MILSETSVLLPLSRIIELALRLGHITVHMWVNLRAGSDARSLGVCLDTSALIACLRTRANSCLIHRLERIVSWHPCIVEVCLLGRIGSLSATVSSSGHSSLPFR